MVLMLYALPLVLLKDQLRRHLEDMENENQQEQVETHVISP